MSKGEGVQTTQLHLGAYGKPALLSAILVAVHYVIASKKHFMMLSVKDQRPIAEMDPAAGWTR
jgi:hypothetical protein